MKLQYFELDKPYVESQQRIEELDWEACVGSIVYNRILEEELASR